MHSAATAVSALMALAILSTGPIRAVGSPPGTERSRLFLYADGHVE